MLTHSVINTDSKSVAIATFKHLRKQLVRKQLDCGKLGAKVKSYSEILHGYFSIEYYWGTIIPAVYDWKRASSVCSQMAVVNGDCK